MLRKTVIAFIYCLSLLALSLAAAGASDLMIINARLIDGTGAAPKYPCSIRIHDGLIVEIGDDLSSNGLEVMDVAGATVMPGLIDSHVHLASVPGATYRPYDEAALWKQRYQQLKAFPAVGVTTVLDCSIGASPLRGIQDHLSNGGIGPRVYALGPAFITKDGYVDDPRMYPDDIFRATFPPAVETQQDVVALFEAYAGIPNIIGVKVFLEYGMSYWHVWPIFTPEMREIIRQEAQKRHLPIWVHAMDEKEQAIALTMNPRTIAHAGYMFGSPSKAHIDHLAAAGVYVNSTQMAGNAMQGEFHPEWYDTSLARLTVPEEQIETVKDPDTWKECYGMLLDISVPVDKPDAIEKFVYLLRRPTDASFVRNSAKALRRMYSAGIPIAMGSDSGNWAIFPNQFHGFDTIMELEAMYNAGIPLDAIIDSSTRIPAEMMGLSDQIGTVEVGKYADLIVLEDDPLSDIQAYRSLLWTIKAGVAKTPQEWMNE